VSGALFGEALDVLFVTCHALAAWIAVVSFVAAVVVVGGCAVGAWAIRGAWRGLTGPLAASEPECDPSAANTPTKPTAPSWARTDKEAA
jgi:hypothetical protein